MQQRLWGKALERLERAIKAGTTDADIFNARGVVLTRLLRHDEAFASFERAESMDASQPGYLLNMAIVRHLQGRRHEAAVLYQQVVEMEPAYEGYLDLGP
jgi:Flp pilus assembly protein TadD